MANQPLTPREKIMGTNAYNHSSKRWLYIGVGTILTSMLGLWGYATFTQLSFFDWGNTLEAKLYRNTKQEFDKLVKENPVLNEKVKERLELIKQEVASSTPVSPTVAGTTTLPAANNATTTIKQ